MSDVRSAWARYAPRFAEEEGAENRASLVRLVELCALAPGARVLDVATGAGYTAFVLRRRGMRVVASDPTHAMLLATRGGWEARRLGGRPFFVEHWAEAMPFCQATFDGVVAHRAAHQFADVEAFVREAARVLRPQGVLGIADQSPPAALEAWHNELERARDPTHVRALSREEWRGVLARAGFRIVAEDVVFQAHDVEAWLDRVDPTGERRRRVLELLEAVPEAGRDVYRPEVRGGRLVMRTPQVVLAASI